MFQLGHLELSCKMKLPKVQDEKFDAENSSRDRLSDCLCVRWWLAACESEIFVGIHWMTDT